MTSHAATDGICWHPVCTIEKYSAAQAALARRRLGGPLTGAYLRDTFSYPEDGIVRDEGNGVTAAGLANLALLLSGTGGYPLIEGRAVFGVGGDATGFDREQVRLGPADGEGDGRTWYRPMDAGFPRIPRPGVIEGQVTFTEMEACFTWREWTWGTGPGRPVAHHALRGCYGGEAPVMINRRASPVGYGEKVAGAAWCFRTEIRLS